MNTLLNFDSMRQYLKYIFGLTGAIILASACEKQNPDDTLLRTSSPSTVDSKTVFSNYDLAQSAIFGITETFCETNSYRGRFLPWYGLNSDIEWYNTYKPGDGKYDIGAYNCTLENSQMNTASNGATNNPWALMYSGIERANLCIEGLRANIPTASDPAGLTYLLGEALTLRAMIYYDLIKAWGDVPARFASTTSATIYLPKTDRDVIFKQILEDLEEAMDYLPWPGASTQTSSTDRINKAFAKGLYARIALCASGYALRPDAGAVGTGNKGSICLSPDAALAKSVLYPKALQHLKDVIYSNSCSLETSFEQMWRNLNNMQNMSAGPAFETLYVIPFGEGRGRWNFTFAISSEGASISGGVTRGGDAGPLPTMYFSYPDGDVRRNISCVNYKWCKDNSIEPAGIGSWYFGKFRFEWMDAQPYTGGNDDGIKPVVMRFADILLMAAEIENELRGPAGAQEWLRLVHQRACGETATDTYITAATASKEAFFNAIVDERAWEFCGEFLRKADLIRWNLLKTKMDKAIASMKALREGTGDYAYLSGRTQIWYQTADDEKSIVIWGLNPTEKAAPAGEWTVVENYLGAKSWNDSKKTGFHTLKIDGLYVNDPDQYMFWPIFKCNIVDSQNTLVNDYNY